MLAVPDLSPPPAHDRVPAVCLLPSPCRLAPVSPPNELLLSRACLLPQCHLRPRSALSPAPRRRRRRAHFWPWRLERCTARRRIQRQTLLREGVRGRPRASISAQDVRGVSQSSPHVREHQTREAQDGEGPPQFRPARGMDARRRGFPARRACAPRRACSWPVAVLRGESVFVALFVAKSSTA